mmetsp:Transcript_82944/g.221627  ORF Transcript_82944/g.221627 Transcript_82944/m.221627 type:complete len:487 (+) Transcript_82944:67-1527(+)
MPEARLRVAVSRVLEQLGESRLRCLTAHHDPALVRCGLFDGVRKEDREELLAAARDMSSHANEEIRQRGLELDRAMGCMVGMAVADSLGHRWEFEAVRDEVSEQRFDLSTFEGHNETNRFQLKPGQWTDDCSMGLCVADSLLLRQELDGADMRLRFWNWWHNGYNNAFRKDESRDRSVGLGGNIGASLEDIQEGCTYVPKRTPSPTFTAKNEDAGNGSLMRNAAVPVFACMDVASAQEIARQQSYATHPGPIAAEACAFLTFACIRALRTLGHKAAESPAKFLDVVATEYLILLQADLHAEKDAAKRNAMELLGRLLRSEEPDSSLERCWNWKAPSLQIENTLRNRGSTYNGYPMTAGYFGSYSMDGLALALWCVYHTTDINSCIVRCVNFLGDADSTGSICAQLAGSIYGHVDIDSRFLAWLKQWDDDDIATRAVLLHEVGRRSFAGVDGNALVGSLPGAETDQDGDTGSSDGDMGLMDDRSSPR